MHTSSWSGKLAPGAAIAALLVAAIVAIAQHRTGTRTATTTPIFGVLQADPHWLSVDSAAGIRLAMINVFWSTWEQEPDRFDKHYADSVRDEVARYRAAGWQVAVDIGLQTPPSWVLQLPSGRLRDQNGHVSNVADYEFSEDVRRAAQQYISAVVEALGPVQYYRVGLSEHGEAKFPDVTADGWWAFEPTAQGNAAGLPPGVGGNPLPGWIPGTTKFRGRPVKTAQVEAWYGWYFGALTNALAWEISAYRSAGYHGPLQLVIPGTGAMPQLYTYRLTQDLAPAPDLDYYRTLNTGSVWWKLLDDLDDLTGVVVDISSVDDQSGTPRANTCSTSDARVDYRTSSAPQKWSDTRWLTYLARLHHLQVMGENPGETPAWQLSTTMALVRSCELIALQWAFEPELHGGPNTNISELATAITRYFPESRR